MRWAWIWLIVRLYVGWEWLTAGWGKLGSSAWTGDDAGAAITGFVQGALAQTGGEPPMYRAGTPVCYRNLVLPYADVWGYVVTFGEILVGIALNLGIFTGIAAFFGSFMNMNYLLAGTVSTNPILFALATLLVGLENGWLVGAGPVGIAPSGHLWRPGLVFREEFRGRRPTTQRPSED